jgi:hypothetical protein
VPRRAATQNQPRDGAPRPRPRPTTAGRARAQARCSLKAIAHLPEAEHLVRAMLAAAPKLRPGAAAAMAHPFFWAPERQLAFLVALSDRMECEDREARAPAPPRPARAPGGWLWHVCAASASSYGDAAEVRAPHSSTCLWMAGMHEVEE